MNEPWFDPNHCGGLLGVLLGFWGAWVGLASDLAHRGKAWLVILGLGLLLAGVNAVVLAAGLTALGSGQPFGVWFCFILGGLLGILAISHALLIFRKRYRKAVEERRMKAEDL